MDPLETSNLTTTQQWGKIITDEKQDDKVNKEIISN